MINLIAEWQDTNALVDPRFAGKSLYPRNSGGRLLYYLQDNKTKIRKRIDIYTAAEIETVQKQIVSQRHLRPLLRKQAKRLNTMIENPYAPDVHRVLAMFHREGIFAQDGLVLVGTYAFNAYRYLFNQGDSWIGHTSRDLDFGWHADKDKKLQAVYNIDLGTQIERLGFRENIVTKPGTNEDKTIYLKEEFKIEFLANTVGNQRTNLKIPGTGGIKAERLPFLDYLLRDNLVLGIPFVQDPYKVRVPHPARFAIHKLAVASLRSGADAAARAKNDIRQATRLVHVYAENAPVELHHAIEAIPNRKDMRNALKKSYRFSLPAETQAILKKLEFETRL